MVEITYILSLYTIIDTEYLEEFLQELRTLKFGTIVLFYKKKEYEAMTVVRDEYTKLILRLLEIQEKIIKEEA